MYGDFMIKQGWECPKCHRVYAPDWPWCNFCGNEQTQIYTTNTLEINTQKDDPDSFEEFKKRLGCSDEGGFMYVVHS